MPFLEDKWKKKDEDKIITLRKIKKLISFKW